MFFISLIYAVSLIDLNGSFFDGFESGSLDTNGWKTGGTGTAWDLSTSVPYAGTYVLFVENTVSESGINTSVNTMGYTNISFSFYAQTYGLDVGEYVAADWYNGEDWIQLMEVQTIDVYTPYNYNLSASASNNPNLAIRFRCSSDGNNEWCKIDNVEVSGIDLVKPNVTIISPQNITYNDSSVLVNLSASDNAKIDKIWFTNSSGVNETYSEALNKTWNEGSNTIYAFTNDTSGNLNSSSQTFYVDLIPKVTILYPLPSAGAVFDEYSEVPIILNVSDLSGIQSIIANVTDSAGPHLVSNFEYSLTSDDFETDTEGVN